MRVQEARRAALSALWLERFQGELPSHACPIATEQVLLDNGVSAERIAEAIRREGEKRGLC